MEVRGVKVRSRGRKKVCIEERKKERESADVPVGLNRLWSRGLKE